MPKRREMRGYYVRYIVHDQWGEIRSEHTNPKDALAAIDRYIIEDDKTILANRVRSITHVRHALEDAPVDLDPDQLELERLYQEQQGALPPPPVKG